MKSKLSFIIGSSIIILAIATMFALSVKKRTAVEAFNSRGAMNQVTDLTNDTLATEIPEQTIPLEPALAETLEVSFAGIRALAFWDELIAAGTENGVFTYRPADSAFQYYHHGNGLEEFPVNALLEFGGKLLVGSEIGLAEIDKTGKITPIDFGFEPPVTALAEHQGALLVGTKFDGVVACQDGNAHQIFDIPEVSALVSGGDQIWVATLGHGLYSYDGTTWKKRFLISDTTIFDYVYDLGCKFNRLYAATPYGLYVFDGGRWRFYNEEHGLLACDLRQVEFSGWKIVVGTADWGIYEIFEDVITPRAWSEGMEVSALVANGEAIVMGTPTDGFYLAQGSTITHINPSPQKYARALLALLH